MHEIQHILYHTYHAFCFEGPKHVQSFSLSHLRTEERSYI